MHKIPFIQKLSNVLPILIAAKLRTKLTGNVLLLHEKDKNALGFYSGFNLIHLIGKAMFAML